jgi:hypothetical protein
MNAEGTQMTLHVRSIHTLISLLLVLSLVLTMNPAFTAAVQMNSYDYQAQGLDRPDLITYDLAKSKAISNG